MKTPVFDFINSYINLNPTRAHMPGHKGYPSLLNIEKYDITEICGADELYYSKNTPSGIIYESEKNASLCFDSKATFFSTEGSSHCIKAMLYLALQERKKNQRPIILAARNVHKSFIYAAALLDFDIEWIYPENKNSICSCDFNIQNIDIAISNMDTKPVAVYITSPDYLGNIADIRQISKICKKHGVLLLVDNAHGAYLHFLYPPCHPLDMGADMCCDSAHKTLPVLTGGAYLHISKSSSNIFVEKAKNALSLFGSTSPSYITLASLDLCNKYLFENITEVLSDTVSEVQRLKKQLSDNGWSVLPSDPLRITIEADEKTTGHEIAKLLRKENIECEYADNNFVVLMLSTCNVKADFLRIKNALGKNIPKRKKQALPGFAKGTPAVSIREAVFSRQKTVPVSEALGLICGSPTVSCPPAIPIAVSGELIEKEQINLFKYYGINFIDVLE